MPTRKPSRKKLKPFSLNLVLLGDPGSGKATQAAYFAKKYYMFDLDMGRELTVLREKNKQASKVLEKNYDKGQLAPTDLVRNIFAEKFTKLPNSKGILFDGTPKMIGEAKLVNKYLKDTHRTNPLVIYLKIPHNEILKRVLNRKGYGDTKFKTRLHDTKEGLKNRARYYRINIKEVTEYFSSMYPLIEIDGLGTRTEVRKRIQKAIDFYIKHYDQIYKT